MNAWLGMLLYHEYYSFVNECYCSNRLVYSGIGLLSLQEGVTTHYDYLGGYHHNVERRSAKDRPIGGSVMPEDLYKRVP